MSTPFLGCVLHAAISGAATALAIAIIPPLAGTAVYCGLLSLAYGIRWATTPHPTSDPSG